MESFKLLVKDNHLSFLENADRDLCFDKIEMLTIIKHLMKEYKIKQLTKRIDYYESEISKCQKELKELLTADS